jgi:hypothetical protein
MGGAGLEALGMLEVEDVVEQAIASSVDLPHVGGVV